MIEGSSDSAPAAASVGTLLDSVQPLGGQVEHLRALARAASPGRTARIIEARVGEMRGAADSLAALGPLSPAEEVVVEVAELFLLDAHGIDDSVMARLGGHYTAAEQVALLFHLALTDGFTRFDVAFDLSGDGPS